MPEKEIWKLLELLNEYETPRSWIVFKSYDDYDGTFYWVDIDGETEIAWSDSMICSKRFWWIARLVEQDKIDFEHMKWHWKIISYLTDEKDYKRNQIKEWVVLMLLSINEQPIELLCSIIKKED